MPTAKRAALYLRMSLDRAGDSAGVDRQEAACRSLAEARGWDVVHIYCDNNVSATKGDRPQWQRMLADAQAGQFDVVLAWALDRLVRRSSDLERLIEAGVRAATVQGDLDLTTVQGELVGGILASVARAEVRQKGERQRAANQQRAQSGQMPWSRRPYGYALDEAGSVHVVQDEADRLRAAVAQILEGASLGSVVRQWNAERSPTSSGGAWTVTSLRRCLLNPRLSGRVTYRGEDVGDGAWEVVLPAAEQDRVGELLRSPSRRTQLSTSRKYLLSGSLRCGRCGAVMYATPAGPIERRYMAYRCRTPHLMRRLDQVDAVVVGAVLGRLARADAAGLFTPDVDLDGLRREVTGLRSRRDDLAQLLAEGLLTASAVRAQAGGLRERLERAEGALATASAASPAAELASAEDVSAAWSSYELGRRRQIVDELLIATLSPAGKGARFDPEHVRIEWRAGS